jgi:hypothetical protein
VLQRAPDPADQEKAARLAYNQREGLSFEDHAMEWYEPQARAKWGGNYVEQLGQGRDLTGVSGEGARPEAMVYNEGLLDAVVDAKSGAIDIPQAKVYVDNLAMRPPSAPPGELVFLVPEGSPHVVPPSLKQYVNNYNVKGTRVTVKFIDVPGWSREYELKRPTSRAPKSEKPTGSTSEPGEVKTQAEPSTPPPKTGSAQGEAAFNLEPAPAAGASEASARPAKVAESAPATPPPTSASAPLAAEPAGELPSSPLARAAPSASAEGVEAPSRGKTEIAGGFREAAEEATPHSPSAEGVEMAANAGGELVTFFGNQAIQSYLDKKGEETRRAKHLAMEPEIQRRVAAQEEVARTLRAGGRQPFANVITREWTQVDQEGIGGFFKLELVDVQVTDKNIQESYIEQLNYPGVLGKIKGWLQMEVGGQTAFHNTFSWALNPLEAASTRRVAPEVQN